MWSIHENQSVNKPASQPAKLSTNQPTNQPVSKVHTILTCHLLEWYIQNYSHHFDADCKHRKASYLIISPFCVNRLVGLYWLLRLQQQQLLWWCHHKITCVRLQSLEGASCCCYCGCIMCANNEMPSWMISLYSVDCDWYMCLFHTTWSRLRFHTQGNTLTFCETCPRKKRNNIFCRQKL